VAVGSSANALTLHERMRTRTVSGHWSWPRDTEYQFSIQIAFDIDLVVDLLRRVRTLIIWGICNFDNWELMGSGGSGWSKLAQEFCDIRALVRLVQVVCLITM
jgi:hypothetical protein